MHQIRLAGLSWWKYCDSLLANWKLSYGRGWILCRRLEWERGTVSGRVALLLRSAEVKPLFQRFVQLFCWTFLFFLLLVIYLRAGLLNFAQKVITSLLCWNGWWKSISFIRSFHLSTLFGVAPSMRNTLHSPLVSCRTQNVLNRSGPPVSWCAEWKARVWCNASWKWTFLWMSDHISFEIHFMNIRLMLLFFNYRVVSTAIGLWKHRIPSDLRS